MSQAQQIEQQLAQAASLASAGGAKNDQAALVLYNDVLSTDPSNPAALAGAGWLMWNLGTSSHVAAYTEDGRSEVTRAVTRVADLLPGPSVPGLDPGQSRTTTTPPPSCSSTSSWPTTRRRTSSRS